jgi:hypothetical protein
VRQQLPSPPSETPGLSELLRGGAACRPHSDPRRLRPWPCFRDAIRGAFARVARVLHPGLQGRVYSLLSGSVCFIELLLVGFAGPEQGFPRGARSGPLHEALCELPRRSHRDQAAGRAARAFPAGLGCSAKPVAGCCHLGLKGFDAIGQRSLFLIDLPETPGRDQRRVVIDRGFSSVS